VWSFNSCGREVKDESASFTSSTDARRESFTRNAAMCPSVTLTRGTCALTANGERSFDANALRRVLGLRSTWFSVGVLSLSGPPSAVTYGSSTRLNGVARGVGGVTLQQQVSGSWQPLGAVKAASDGALAVAVAPKVTTVYRLAASKITAGAARVPVAPVVRLVAPRAPTELSGKVRPILAGTAVAIQRQQGTGWATVAHATLDARGLFHAQMQLTSGTYRARVPAGHGLVAGVSAVLQVTTP
jgi:hypothetical protein